MKNKKLFMWVMIIAIAIIVTSAIIYLPASAYSGNKEYQENITINSEVILNPEEVVEEFYGWYLSYIGDRSSGEFHNPLSEGAYRDCEYLSSSFIGELEEMLANGISADPILLAQDIPHEFSVDPGSEKGTVIVHLQFGDSPSHDLQVRLVDEYGSWKINDIDELN